MYNTVALSIFTLFETLTTIIHLEISLKTEYENTRINKYHQNIQELPVKLDLHEQQPLPLGS